MSMNIRFEKHFLYLNKLLKNWQKNTSWRSLIFWAYINFTNKIDLRFLATTVFHKVLLLLNSKREIPKEESDLLKEKVWLMIQ